MAKSESFWRQESQRVIARTLAGLPGDATLDDKRRALRAAYPFGERRHHPYKIWCDEQRKSLGSLPKEAVTKFELHKWTYGAQKRHWFIQVHCDYCGVHVYKSGKVHGCLMCRDRLESLDSLLADSSFMSGLKTIRDYPSDSFARGVLADWLEERGCRELAELFRASMGEVPVSV